MQRRMCGVVDRTSHGPQAVIRHATRSSGALSGEMDMGVRRWWLSLSADEK